MRSSDKKTKVYFQKIDPSAKLPSYAYEGDAGMDLFSSENKVINPSEKAVLSTGLKVALPSGFGGFVWDKSGLAVKNHITTLAGVVDSNYRGELKVVLANLGANPHVINKGDKIAQFVVKPVEEASIEEISDIEKLDSTPTSRGDKRFGSSGTQ
ncbi:MAG: dUTP diphosphatase [Candidatus Spechtbacterales bacterium]|nr:dUTP diphosphatase [Candidatus Spechtbacterales bacterium]